MAEYNLAVIAGDGIGPEVIDEGRKVLDAVAAQTEGLSCFSCDPVFMFHLYRIYMIVYLKDRPGNPLIGVSLG